MQLAESTLQKALKAASHVNGERLWSRHMEMARIGATARGGVNRQAFSAEDISARKLLATWAKARGYRLYSDALENLFIRRDGQDANAAPVVTGSHLDSQPQGGKFDGTFGVLAGIEALEAMEMARLITPRPIEVVAWSNEEGSRYAPGAMGSMAFAGQFDVVQNLTIKDREGHTLGAALKAVRSEMPQASLRPLGFPIAAYIEAHIEQGPILEANGCQIGIVTGIQGARWFNVNVIGEAAHAGTTPAKNRKDAMQAAIAIIGRLNERMSDSADLVRFTVGRFDVLPNSPNTIADRVSFSIDFRHPDPEQFERLSGEILRLCQDAQDTCEVRVAETLNKPPIAFPANVVNSVANAAERLGYRHMHLSSGAFHDALFINDMCPTGMIFVPCEKGISHNEAENAKAEDLEAGTKVLTAALVEAAYR